MSIQVGIIGGGGIASHHIRGYQQTDAKIVMISTLEVGSNVFKMDATSQVEPISRYH